MSAAKPFLVDIRAEFEISTGVQKPWCRKIWQQNLRFLHLLFHIHSKKFQLIW